MHKLTKKPSTTYYLPSSKYSKARQTLNEKSESKGFTIVELLVVIVVIAILAAITIVSYTGISNKAVASSIQSDLDNASKALKLFQVDNMAYPATISTNCSTNPTTTTPPTNLCLKISSANNYVGYSANNSSTIQSFLLIAGNGTTNYQVTNTTSPTLLAQLQPGVTPGAVLELRASKANSGLTQGINSPLTTTWTDTSGNNNNGTLTNFGGTTASGWAGAGTTGDPYRAVFDGSGYVSHPTVALSATASTCEYWLRPADFATVRVLHLDSYPYLYVALRSTYVRLRTTTAINEWAVPEISTSELTHIVITRNGGYSFAYKNGLASSTGPIAISTDLNLVALGKYSEAVYQWKGDIVLARIYPYALSAAQVAANYAAGAN